MYRSRLDSELSLTIRRFESRTSYNSAGKADSMLSRLSGVIRSIRLLCEICASDNLVEERSLGEASATRFAVMWLIGRSHNHAVERKGLSLCDSIMRDTAQYEKRR